ncbi:SNF2-related protein [Bernardetia sp. Wsw4-3y2]|uniref:SNF2-related protein n=1 Tax=Bernardetia sp. Wsw4-3y2 TaxID=3127471 RepID=UPI0030D1CF0D
MSSNYYSERIGLINHISAKMQRYGQHKDKETAQDYKALQYGFISDFVRSQYKKELEELESKYDKSVEPTPEELCSYGNFFIKNPNKTVGKKFLSTSFYFSVQSKATLQESVEMLKREIDKLKKMPTQSTQTDYSVYEKPLFKEAIRILSHNHKFDFENKTVEEKKHTGWDKTLLKNGLYTKLKHAKPSDVTEFLDFIIEVQSNSKTKIFTPKHKVWNLYQGEINKNKVVKDKSIYDGMDLYEISKSDFVKYLRVEVTEKGHIHIHDFKGYIIIAFTPDSTSGKEYNTDKKAYLYKLHRSIIEKAISEGKNIPQNVLNDYPELTNPNKLKLKMKIKAKALQLRRKRALALLKMELKGLSGLDGILGCLGEVDKKGIESNRSKLAQLIAKETDSKKLINTFEDNFKRYNQGITLSEIKAWVWYKQSQGSPMRGWEKYFIKTSGKVEEVLVTIQPTRIKDNRFIDEVTVPSGSLLGKPTRFKNKYGKDNYVIFTDKEGSLKWVNKSHVKTERTQATADPKEIDKLIKEGVLFFGEADLLPLPLYTFGNIYDKILALETQKEYIVSTYGQVIYDNHVRVLEDAKPRSLSVLNPDSTKRLKILPFSEFALKYKVEEDADGNPVEKNLNEFFKSWLSRNANLIEVDGISVRNIIDIYLEGGRKPKAEKEFLEKYTREEGDRLFDIFLNKGISINDQKRLDMSWNRQYNGFAKLNYKRVPIGLATCALFKGMPLTFMDAQREAIAFIDATGSGCLGYDVGVGKTMAAILIAAQNIQNGTYLRPLIVVPKPTYQKWINEIVGYTDKKGNFIEGILSHLDIKINSLGNMGKGYINPKTINKQVEEGSVSIVTYEGLAKIGFSESLEEELFSSLAKILLHVDDNDTETEREKEKQFERLRYLIGRSAKGTIADIDVMGFDSIFVDEAHNFRNVFAYVPAQEGTKRYSVSGQVSGRAQSLFMICNYIQNKFGGNVILLTATPFNNSPLEVYSMLSLIALNKMQKAGIGSITEFMETFIQETSEYVVSSTNSLKQRPVVKSFQNKRSLQSLVFNYINFKTGEDAGVRRPVKINLPRLSYKDTNGNVVQLAPKDQITTYLEMTELQKIYQEQAIRIAESGSGLKERGANTLIGMSLSRKNAFSPFMISKDKPEDYQDFVDNSPKIKYTMECIKSIQEYHKKTNTPMSGQIIYSNIGKDFFPFIKEYLEKKLGFKTGVTLNNRKFDEVEIITSDGTADRKEAIKEAFLNGTVKVIIGSATIREGIDLQRRGTTIFNLYPDFNPTDLRQLEGRIWRQGNEFGYVRVVIPLIQNSMDVFIFQKLEEKSARINDIWSKADDDSNVLDQESLNPSAIKYALFTDLKKLTVLRLEEIEKDISKSKVKLENELSTLSKIEAAQKVANSSKIRVIDKIDSLKIKLLGFLELHKDTKKEENELNKKITKYKGILDLINVFDKEDDKALVKLGIKIQQMEDWSYNYFREDGNDQLGLFRASLTIISQSKDIILRYESLEKAIETIQKSLDNQNEELKKLNTAEFKNEILNEIVEEKKKLNIEGRSPQDAAKYFASLNYLLDYKMADVNDINGNPLPTDKPKSTPVKLLHDGSKDKLKIKLKLKAKALQLRRKRALALLKFAA